MARSGGGRHPRSGLATSAFALGLCGVALAVGCGAGNTRTERAAGAEPAEQADTRAAGPATGTRTGTLAAAWREASAHPDAPKVPTEPPRRLLFFAPGGLTPNGKAVLRLCAEWAWHALDPAPECARLADAAAGTVDREVAGLVAMWRFGERMMLDPLPAWWAAAVGRLTWRAELLARRGGEASGDESAWPGARWAPWTDTPPPPTAEAAAAAWRATFAQALETRPTADLIDALQPRGDQYPRLVRAHGALLASDVDPETTRAVRRALIAWREAPPRPAYYVAINLPDQHGEVWRDGERLHRFRVAIGRPTVVHGDDGPNTPDVTPTLASAIETIVLNPEWNVPSRLYAERIRPQIPEDATADERALWLHERGYHVIALDTPGERIVQRPGARNALGAVKFLFPNPHDVYLHDTPEQAVFRRDARAISSGCVRVHRPLALLRVLLENDGGYDAAAVREVLATGDSVRVKLARPVPIFIDYVPVRVDDDGEVRLLPDVYGRWSVTE